MINWLLRTALSRFRCTEVYKTGERCRLGRGHSLRHHWWKTHLGGGRADISWNEWGAQHSGDAHLTR